MGKGEETTVFEPCVNAPDGLPKGGVGGILIGMREHRERFDSDTATTRKLSPDDPSAFIELEDDPDAG